MNEVKTTREIRIGKVTIGGTDVVIIAGPCAVESEQQINEIAPLVKESGASVLRGGAFKPRTSPDSFQGLAGEGLRYLQSAGNKNDIPVVTEVMDAAQIPLLLKHADMLQVGARNMQNFTLLKELGKVDVPVLLKRGLAATLDELLGAAEYIISGGNTNVVLCERGIRTFETRTRATLDLSAIPVLKELTNLPVIVDPSHAAGRPEIIPALSKAAIAAGADGLIIEVHNNPEKALCDGEQAMLPDDFKVLMEDIGAVAQAVGRNLYSF